MGFYTHRGRLALVLVLLVILPTALLSVLAGRSIRAREVLLRRHLADTAGETLADGIDRLHAELDAALRALCDSMNASIERSGAYADLDRVGHAAVAAHPVAIRPFVFLTPWGFVYPSTESNAYAATALTLNQAITATQPGQARYAMSGGGQLFRFDRLTVRKELYAGFEVSVPQVVDLLRQSLAQAERAGGHIDIRIGTPAPRAPETDSAPDVLVSDTLTSDAVASRPAPVARWPSIDAGTALAGAALRPPLDFIAVTISERPLGAARHARLWNHLYHWGILLLAVAICAGSGLIVQGALRLALESRRRSEFVAGMSHDLRTPVTSMRMLAESLYHNRIADADKRHQFLGTIVRECERLGDVVERILFFIRQDSQALAYARNPVAVNELLESVTTTFADRIAGRASFHVHPSPAPAVVMGDREALAKVLLNLLDNAVKYGTTPDARDIEVAATLRHAARRRHDIEITVTDRGCGIPLHERRRIFERFYRVVAPGREHVGGAGLGLALCHDIVRAHQGRIWVTGGTGNAGSTFHVLLPAVTSKKEHQV